MDNKADSYMEQLAIKNIYKILLLVRFLSTAYIEDAINLETELTNYASEKIVPIIMMYNLKSPLNVLENFNKTVNKIAEDTVKEIDKKHFEMILKGSLAEKDCYKNLKTIQKLAKKGIDDIYSQYFVYVYDNSSEDSMPVRMPWRNS